MNPITAILGLAGTIIDKIWPNRTEAEKAAFALALQQELDQTQLLKGQMDINATEAASSNVFVSGWRPFIGWVCGSAFAWVFVLQPIFLFLMALAGKPVPALPALGMETLMPVLLGLLGLGGFRTYEKVKGVARG